MNPIRITIGIPTYNRAVDIRGAIESVLAQMNGGFHDRLDILVSDNASTDSTQEVVRDYMSRYPERVTYRRNPHNIGFSRNVDALIRHARGEFVLLLSDDDVLDDNALAVLWDILDQHGDVGLVFLSETPYDSALREPLFPKAGHVSRKGGVLYRPGLEYVRKNRIFPPFLLSGYVVRRNAWIRADATEFHDTLCVHTLTALKMALVTSVYWSHAPSIRYRSETSTGVNRWLDELYPFTFYLNLLAGCRSVGPYCPAVVHRYLHQQAMRSIAYNIMNLKVTSGRLPPLLRNRLKKHADRGDPLYWCNLMLLLAPLWMIRILFKIAARLRSTR